MTPQAWSDVCRVSTAGFKLYLPKHLPVWWVVEDATGKLWVVPAVDQGWKRRTIYSGTRDSLDSVELVMGYGIGLPITTYDLPMSGDSSLAHNA
jgi:hypothetical protein